MKVIFLDHDGVVCLSQQWGSRSKKRKKWSQMHAVTTDGEIPVEYRLDNFDPKAVTVLNRILEKTGAEIVVSSDWKLHATLEEMRDLYEKYGVMKPPIDFTPNLKDFDNFTYGLYQWKGWQARARIVEIRKYLEEHDEVKKWVAIDDLDMGREGLENFILCSRMSEGIKQSGIYEKITEML